jgi:hypothetical protein
VALRGIFASVSDRDSPPVAPGPALPPLPPLGDLPPARPVQRREEKPVLAGVYFIRADQEVKIGMSNNVHQRMKALSTMSPVPLELLAVVAGAHLEEAQLHRKFAHLRMHGEWFRAEPELLDFIESLNAHPDPIAAAQEAK